MSDPAAASPNDAWDAQTYDRRFGFVADLGRDLITLLEPQDGERILDLGCGTGTLTAQLASTGAEVVGVDADPGMIRQARQTLPELRFEVADGQDLVASGGQLLRDGPFDVIFSNAALHWMRRADAVAAGMVHLLRPGGRVVAELGAAGNVATIVAAVREAAEELGGRADRVASPWYFPTAAEHATVLERAGLRVRYLAELDRPTPLDDCPDGVADWLRMFGGGLLAGVHPDLREEVISTASARCAPMLYRDGRWFADYRRLRFHAELPPTPRG